jgi:hypothetical protein
MPSVMFQTSLGGDAGTEKFSTEIRSGHETTASPALTRDLGTLGTLGTLGAVDTVVSDGSHWNGKTRKASVLLRTSVAYG